MREVNKPNFFILGAAKSGTTSLYYALNQHPDVFLSDPKEPTFFCEDYQVVKNPIHYFELFDGVENEKIIGEASHAYLSDPKSARVLKALFPEAKFVLIFRNPAERAYSLYHHMRRYRFETIDSFEKALKEEDDRFNSSHFRDNNPQSFYNFMYYQSGLYGAQLQRYYSFFDRSQFHILTMDQLKNDFNNSINNIFNFLDIDANVEVIPEVHNKGFTVKSDAAAKSLNSWTFRKLGLTKHLAAQLGKNEIPKINPETKNMLMEKYKDDQQLLESLCGVKFDS